MLRVSAPSLLSVGDYLVWGTDAPEDFRLSPDVPPPFELRLRRTWAYTITDGGDRDGVGTVQLRFLVRGLYLSPSPQDSALLFDDDGDFSDARVFPGLPRFEEGAEALEFSGVELGHERFFSLAVKPL